MIVFQLTDSIIFKIKYDSFDKFCVTCTKYLKFSFKPIHGPTTFKKKEQPELVFSFSFFKTLKKITKNRVTLYIYRNGENV